MANRKRKPRTIKCPYTGVVQDIVLDDALGRRNGYHLNCGLDLTLPFLSKQDAIDACPESVCRYTGKPITLTELQPGLWHYPDAYSPAKRWYTEQHARYYGSMRKGRSFEKKPETAKISVKEREAPPPDPFADVRARPDIGPLVHEALDSIDP